MTIKLKLGRDLAGRAPPMLVPGRLSTTAGDSGLLYSTEQSCGCQNAPTVMVWSVSLVSNPYTCPSDQGPSVVLVHERPHHEPIAFPAQNVGRWALAIRMTLMEHGSESHFHPGQSGK